MGRNSFEGAHLVAFLPAKKLAGGMVTRWASFLPVWSLSDLLNFSAVWRAVRRAFSMYGYPRVKTCRLFLPESTRGLSSFQCLLCAVNKGDDTTQTTTRTIRTTQTDAQTLNESTEEKILSLIQRNPRITQVQLARELSASINTVKYYIRKLSKEQVIKREGTVHNGRWIVL